MKGLSWKAIKKENVYCAPACGSGCTYDQYLKAKDTAMRVRSSLHRPHGWKVKVFENLGWHSQIEKGDLSLHWFEHNGKMIYSIHCSLPFQMDLHNADPNEAIKAWLYAMNNYISLTIRMRDQII